MAIKVSLVTGLGKVFPHATDWYSGEDKTLQIYQAVAGEAQFTIAEFADGQWEYVQIDPLPLPDEGPNEQEQAALLKSTEGNDVL